MAFTFKHGDQPLEGYTIQRGVGRGGFGEVYYAVSEGGKEVALKYLRDNPTVELRGVSHCINLKSPHLVTIFDVKPNADGDYFIIMEYVSGPSLRDLLIAEPNGLGLQKAAFFTREIGKGLSYLHDRGIVHRDLKPGNIFYEDGYVKIGDYGLAKIISVSKHSGQTASVGTVHYMAPEVGTGNYHRGIDIYALGVMLYEMLLGKVPFEGSTMGEVLMKHLTQQAELDELPAPFASVIRKALAKDPQDRYQTVDEMVTEILAESEVERSVATFRPDSIRQIARHAMETQIADSPARSPVRPPRPGVIPPPPLPNDAFARSAELARNAAQVAVDFANQQAGRAPRAPMGGGHGNPVAMPMGGAVGGVAPHERPWGRIVLAVLIVGAITGIMAGLFGGEDDFIFPAFGFVVAIATGASIGYRVLNRMPAPDHPGWATRLVTLGCSAIPVSLVGVVSLASDAIQTPKLILAALLMSGLVDWTKRVYHGLQGRLMTGEAITAGIWGLVITAVVCEGTHEDEYKLMMGGVGAATSIALQAGLWLFRRRDPSVPAPAAGGKGQEWYRRQCVVEAPSRKGEVERAAHYFASLGYKVEEKSRRSISATRGTKHSIVWATDIRTYKTELRVRAEEAGGGRTRFDCRYKVWTDGSSLGDDQIAVLDGEISQLARVLGGDEVRDGGPDGVHIRTREGVVAGAAPVERAAHARAAVINTPFDGRPTTNWPPPPPARRQALPPERKTRSTFGRVFWSFVTAALVANGVGLIVWGALTIDRQDDETAAVVRAMAREKAPKDADWGFFDRIAREPSRVRIAETDGEYQIELPSNFDHAMSWQLQENAPWMIRHFEEMKKEDSVYRAYATVMRTYESSVGYPEATGFLAGGLASLAMSFFAFLKTTRHKRYGLWRETLKPFFMCACLAGIGTFAAILGTFGFANDADRAPFIIPLVFCSLSFVLLIFIRGKSYPIGGPQFATA